MSFNTTFNSCARATGQFILGAVTVSSAVVALAATVAIAASILGAPIAAAAFSMKAKVLTVIGASLAVVLTNAVSHRFFAKAQQNNSHVQQNIFTTDSGTPGDEA